MHVTGSTLFYDKVGIIQMSVPQLHASFTCMHVTCELEIIGYMGNGKF